jgi:hypothetical protein
MPMICIEVCPDRRAMLIRGTANVDYRLAKSFGKASFPIRAVIFIG